ncbi:NRAMP family divalent metal transporter [Olivibacter sp. XZL3]|uniref:NRAMP family divalent metal transporter n=1 Tax=Olivibacter sp. XZL3 TaxID=1735116 RepID=UPI0010671099|nr:NRAMP family divalent metal transporter [Olivibacter sp. XZL3]
MKKTKWQALLGAAFLMATSAIGPGFLTQTAVFTAQLGASFGFIILTSIVLDIIVQLNIWRVIVVAGLPAQQIANKLVGGLGYFIASLVFLGGLAFNIGNIGGAGLGLTALLNIDTKYGAALSAVVALAIFAYKEATKAMDLFTKILGLLMIVLMLYVALTSNPPLREVAVNAIIPAKFDFNALLTIVGGTVGGYITFAGAHRLLDANISGTDELKAVNKGAASAIGIASLMRTLLFLAAIGVVSKGLMLDQSNPPASVFKLAGGEFGYRLFGLVMWSAAITSVIGSAYTSISFIKSFHPKIDRFHNLFVIIFILTSGAIFLAVGQPVKTLIIAGALNGLILPISLSLMLIAAYKTRIVGEYKQPTWLTAAGVVVIIFMSWIGYKTIWLLLN